MFKFKLNAVWNYRQVVEEKKQLEFADGQRQLEKEQAALEQIIDEKARLTEQLKKMQHMSFNVADISLYLSYHELYNKKEEMQMEIVRAARTEVDCRRSELLEAVQQRKVMDKLNEDQLREYQKEMAGRERRDADETAVTRFIRKKK